VIGPVWVAGGETLIGRALLRALDRAGIGPVVGRPGDGPDIGDAAAVDAFFARVRPAVVLVAAGKTGGILANQTEPATLMHENLLVACHVIDAARRHGTARLLYLASSCAYPRDAEQPMVVDDLLTGPLEPTCEPYALAKLAGLVLVRAVRREHRVRFVAGITADVYGPGDDFGLASGHVVPALVHKMVEARLANAPVVELWGTGRPVRDFLYVDDLAEACLLVVDGWDDDRPINLSAGAECSIAELAEIVREATGFRGAIRFDPGRPDGTPRKALDASALRALGWRPRTTIAAGVAHTLDWYLAQRRGARGVGATTRETA
jgi:GDP-L-fucose synthase